MVSKFIRKTPIKPTKDRRSSRLRKRSPLKNVVHASSVFFASINKSIFTCHRRLVKIFSKLAKISTPIRRKQQGFQLLQKLPNEEEEEEEEVLIELVSPVRDVRRTLLFKSILPPSFYPDKKTIFLDLDETLIHSQTDPPSERFDFIVRPTIEGQVMTFYVLKRPGVDEFLESIAENYEIIVFTAGLKEYASLVLDKLDTKRLISYRLYRDSCKEMDGRFVKDLSEIGRDLKNVVLVDDNPNAYLLQPANALPVRPFISNSDDRELQKVKKFFESADRYEDLRDAVKCFVWEEEQRVGKSIISF